MPCDSFFASSFSHDSVYTSFSDSDDAIRNQFASSLISDAVVGELINPGHLFSRTSVFICTFTVTLTRVGEYTILALCDLCMSTKDIDMCLVMVSELFHLAFIHGSVCRDIYNKVSIEMMSSVAKIHTKVTSKVDVSPLYVSISFVYLTLPLMRPLARSIPRWWDSFTHTTSTSAESPSGC